MDLSQLKKKCTFYLGKYKFVLLILCLGLIFIFLPTGSSGKTAAEPIKQHKDESYISQEELAEILSKIEGAGRVEVMLSVASSSKTDYQSDKDGSASASERSTTVTISDSDRNETGLITKTDAPVYRGAIIVCDGANNPSVQLSVINAVSNITGLGTNQISVLKMK